MSQQKATNQDRQPEPEASEAFAQPARPGDSRKLRIALAWLTFVGIGIPGGAFGVAWPAMRDTWQLPTAWLGILLLALTGGYLSGAFVSGRLIVRRGMGNTLVLASGIIFLGLAGFALAPAWLILIATGFVLGVGQGIIDAAINLYFANHFDARMMNWLHASFSVGTTLGPFLMQLAGTAGEAWRMVWFAIALGQLLLTIAFALTRSSWHTFRVPVSAPAVSTPSTLATLKRPSVLAGMLLFFVLVGIESSAGSWSYTLFSESRGVNDALAATWVGLYWGFFALGRIVYGFLAERIVARSGIYVLLLAILLGALMFSLRDNVAVSVAGLLLIGFAQAPVFPLLITATPRRLGAGHATNAIGFQISAAGLGIAVLPALVGYLAGFDSLEILGPFLALSALVCLFLFGAISRKGEAATN